MNVVNYFRQIREDITNDKYDNLSSYQLKKNMNIFTLNIKSKCLS